MRIRIRQSMAKGTVAAPPSKSAAHRLLIGGALAGGGCIGGVADSEDMLATMDCARALGARFERRGDHVLFTGGIGPESGGSFALLPCRESGSTLRFFLPLALACREDVLMTGTPRLLQRGVGVYEELLKQRNIRVDLSSDGIRMSGRLRGGEMSIPGNISSQYATGLLMTLPLMAEDSRLTVRPPVESRPYMDLTLEILKKFGIRVTEAIPGVFDIPGRQRYQPLDTRAEGDWSNAAALLVYNLAGGDVRVTGLREDSVQGDRVCLAAFDSLKSERPEWDLSDCPDLAPVLFAAAAALHGAVFTGTRRLAIKESDRRYAMAEELAAFGVRAEVEEDRVTVHPATLHAPSRPLNAHNDHRLVMALSFLCSLTGGEIDGAEAIRKSYPGFFRDLAALGVSVTECPERTEGGGDGC